MQNTSTPAPGESAAPSCSATCAQFHKSHAQLLRFQAQQVPAQRQKLQRFATLHEEWAAQADPKEMAGWLESIMDRLNDISVSQIAVVNFEVVNAIDAITDEMRAKWAKLVMVSSQNSSIERT